MNPIQRLPEFEAAVRRLGAWQLEGSRSLAPGDVRVKHNANGERSVVTSIDLESEQRLRQLVHEHFPDHSFLGEETGNHVRDPEHYWIVDPIDGTTNFTHGIPYWGPSMAYWHRGEPVLAIVYFPALQAMFTARAGGGALQDGRPIRTSDAGEYTPLTTVALHSRTHYAHALRSPAKVRVLGSIIGNMCLTACGTFVAAHGRGRLWDIAAGILVLREAGAIVELQPDYLELDLPNYATQGSAGDVITLFARANENLQPLSELLEHRPHS